MHRFDWSTSQDALPGRPEMTITEAAEAMERQHSRQILVGNDRAPVGVLSEEDIVTKVLAMGLDPNRVRVEEIMARGRVGRDGAFRIEDESGSTGPLWAAERLGARDDDDGTLLTNVMEGRCEECGVFSDELFDHEGLEMCAECSGLRLALFQ